MKRCLRFVTVTRTPTAAVSTDSNADASATGAIPVSALALRGPIGAVVVDEVRLTGLLFPELQPPARDREVGTRCHSTRDRQRSTPGRHEPIVRPTDHEP